MITIILADDHLVIRQKLKRLLAQEPAWRVSAEAGDGLEAVRLTKEVKPDVLVTDLALPGLHGLQVTRRVHRQSLRTRIIVVSIHADEQYVRQAARNGALGYVRKDEVGQHLLPAIRSALAGKPYLSPSVVELAASPVTNREFQFAADTYESLNPRERSAFQLIAQGCTDAVLASRLRSTLARARLLRARLMHRLSLQTHAEIAAFAREIGLAPKPRASSCDH